MDENQVLLSLRILTENTKVMLSDISKVQNDVSKVENDVSILKSTGVSVSSTSSGGSTVNAQIDASSIADGSVSNTEFQHLAGVTSSIQTQLTNVANQASNAAMLPTGTTDDDAKLLKYSNSGSANPSFNFAALKDDGSNIDANLTFRVNNGVHNPGTNFAVSTAGDVSSGSFTAKNHVNITASNAGGPGSGSTTVTPFRCQGGASIGPDEALDQTTPEQILLNGVIGLGAIADTSITDATRYGTAGQVLTSQGAGSLPTWTTVSSGGGGGSTAVYLAADASVASGASDGFINYSPSPIVQNGTFSNNAFSPNRLGDYKVTSNLTFTGGSATVRVGKSLTQLSNNILNAARSYDFRTANGTYTTTATNLFNVTADSASLILDSGSADATINTSDGYQGGTSHYIDLTSFPTGSQLPTDFAFELVLKLNSPSGSSSTSNQPILVVHKDIRGNEEHIIRLFRYSTTSDLRLQFTKTLQADYGSYDDHQIIFNNNYQEFEHLFIQFTSSGCTVYRNGVQATATQGTSNPNNNTVNQTASDGTAINVSKVTLGRYLDRYGADNPLDNGLEHIKFFRYYTMSATADEVRSLYEQHALQLDILGKSSGSGTVITQAIAQQLATTDSIKVHAEGSFTGYSGDAALIVEHVDGGAQGPAGPAGTGVPDVSTGTSGQVLTLDSSNPAQAVWADISSGDRQPLFFHAQATTQGLTSGAYATAWILKKENSDNFSSQFDSSANNNFVFHCRRATDYKIDLVTTLDHTTTGNKATEVMLEKHRIYTGLTNDIVTAAASYDFRNATYTSLSDTTVARQYTLSGMGSNSAELHVDANESNPLISTTDGVQGSAASFIALDAADIPLHDHIGAGSSGFSFEFSMKVNSATDGALIDIDVDSGANFSNSIFKVFHRGNEGEISIVYMDSNGNVQINGEFGEINFNNDAFVHFVITMEGGGTMKVYQNGALDYTFNNNPIGTDGWNITGARIGRQNNLHGGSLRDNCIEQIRYLRFYTSVLDANKVSELHNAHVNGIGIFELDKAGDDTEITQSNLGSQQLSLSTIARLELDERLAIKYITSGSFNIGYYTNLFVTAQLGPQGPQGPAGTGLPSITGTSGQVLTLDSSSPPQAVWTTPSAPSYISWKLANNITLNGSNADDGGWNHRIKDFDIYTHSGVAQVNNITYNTTTGDFTIITPGLYNYSFTAVATPASGDYTGERYFAAIVYINNTLHAIATGLVDWVESDNSWNRNNICLNNIAYLNTGDIVHFKAQKSADNRDAILVANGETNGFLAKIG